MEKNKRINNNKKKNNRQRFKKKQTSIFLLFNNEVIAFLSGVQQNVETEFYFLEKKKIRTSLKRKKNHRNKKPLPQSGDIKQINKT